MTKQIKIRSAETIVAVWKVYSVLIEFCCQTDYQMLIQTCTQQLESEIENVKERAREDADTMWADLVERKELIDSLKQQEKDLRAQLDDETSLRKKVEGEMDENKRSHENEINLRLKFETKLNSLHAIHRELENKYKWVENELSVFKK